ncbi:hypothetical protein BDF19DRAFT_417350 [Syncephalis fuscata]|nr:hypothetical protein BDF19DRAFT_417350 [Syncephalis fuscata]
MLLLKALFLNVFLVLMLYISLDLMEEQQLKGLKFNKTERAWSETELNQIYSSVTKPTSPKTTATIKPKLLGRYSKVDKNYLRNLDVQYLETRKDEELKQVALQLESTLKLIETAVTGAASTTITSVAITTPTISLNRINSALQMSAMLRQTDTSAKLFEYMKSLKIYPDIRSYNFLIDVHANVADLEKVTETFKAMEEADIKPNEVTMGGLIKAYINNRRVDDAFKTYQVMRSRNLQPNQMIMTMLMKGCVQAGQLDRAWITFDHMRFEICRPDEVSYSLMIHACAKGNQVERAMNLFEEMARAKLNPTDVTFNALIGACAQAFQLLIQMADYGFMADIYTYNALLAAAARQGDIERARNLFFDMLKRAKKEPELAPDEATYTNMFMAYAATARNGWAADAMRRQQNEAAKLKENNPPVTLDSKKSTTLLSVIPGDEGPLLPFVPTTPIESNAESKPACHPPKLSVQLVNGYLAVQLSYRMFEEANRVYEHVYDELKLVRDGWTYSLALQLHTEKSGHIKKAWQIWNTLQAWWKSEDENPAISAVIKTTRRQDLGCEPQQRHNAYKLMINGLARQAKLGIDMINTYDAYYIELAI